MALKYAGIEYEHREIALRDKPKSMLEVSPKGTVPVLCTNEMIIDQSLDIMHWALEKFDPDGWKSVDVGLAKEWIDKNDGPFKKLLDQYKYPNRHPEFNPEAILSSAIALMLKPLEEALNANQYLLSKQMTWVDVAIFPFIRQFSMVNPHEFDRLPFPKTKKWLEHHLKSELFNSVMEKHPTWVD
jgi:glutathione S-transferase